MLSGSGTVSDAACKYRFDSSCLHVADVVGGYSGEELCDQAGYDWVWVLLGCVVWDAVRGYIWRKCCGWGRNKKRADEEMAVCEKKHAGFVKGNAETNEKGRSSGPAPAL